MFGLGNLGQLGALGHNGGPPLESAIGQLRALLFANGEPGVLYDNTDPTTLFQDLAGSTPVTALGQSVRRQLDLSGRGNHRFQPTSDACRPLWTTDAQGRVGLRYDGTDDWLQTGTITPGTDKVQVFGVWRKLGAGTTCMLELGTNATSARTNLLTDSNGYAFYSGGGIGRTASVGAGYAPPVTNVVTGLGDISGDLAILRVNGVEVARVTLDQGAGNYAANPMFFGRRGGTSIPFNGHELAITIVRFGPNLTTPQIQQVEALLNQIAGGVY